MPLPSPTVDCTLCGQPTISKHTIRDIPYYYCSACNFLFNTYWEAPESRLTDLVRANDKRRRERWPAGEQDHMWQKGWEILELMGWPLAWWSRQLHGVLNHVPGYRGWVRTTVKQRLPKILDFGCGHGVSVLTLRERDGIDIIGLDPFSPIESPHVIRRSLLEEHFPTATFDAIFTIETMEHIPNVLEIFRELQRILKPGGVLLVQTRRLEDPDYRTHQERWFYLEDPTTHVSIYSEPAMRKIAELTGWRDVSFRGVRFAKFIK
jgi:SAM-dependent methyltransferase